MSGLWLVSYIILWLIVIVIGLIVVALAREIEVLHKQLDSLRPYLLKADSTSQVSQNTDTSPK
jgi:predicted Holliday junction resolvase-like endonuclease